MRMCKTLRTAPNDRRLLALAVFVWLSACSVLSLGCAATAAPAIKPCTLAAKVRLEASERINPDSDGAPLPTVVRVYQLRAVDRVEESDFTAIWQSPEQALGPDLTSARELTLFPGQSELLELSLKPEVRFLVAVAIYRRPTASQWRSITPLPDSARMCQAYEKRGVPTPALTFRFDQYRVEGRSHLLRSAASHDLPRDVAPDEEARR